MFSNAITINIIDINVFIYLKNEKFKKPKKLTIGQV